MGKSEDKSISLEFPLGSLIFQWGIVLGNPHYFDFDTLFWSFSRLLLHYNRVVTRCLEYTTNQGYNYDQYLESDLENFIIWYRIILNDLAGIIRKIYPADQRGMPKFYKGTISFFKLKKYFINNSGLHPELSILFKEQAEWLDLLKDQRDDIIHFKARVVVFFDKELKFQIISPIKCPMVKTEKGESKVNMLSINEFVNEQLLKLYNFMNLELVNLYKEYLYKNNISINKLDNFVLSGEGIKLFKINNNL